MNTAIKVSNIWKIFGEQEKEVYQYVLEHKITKQEVLDKFNCVVGVANVSFEVQEGQIYCVMGLSGSGKSTLVRHLNRLLEPTSGEVIINNVNVMELSYPDLQDFRNRHIAMVFQNFGLMPHRSVLDNIALPLEIRGVNKNERLHIAEQNLDRVELTGWGNKFAHELSGGMQQRIGLARALAANPDILLMDEPFSALDPLIRRQLQDQFMKLASEMKKTTIFITHDLDEAVRIGDRIAIMRDGYLIQEGTPEEIVMHPVDDYVSDFVAGISRLKVVKAHAVMKPIDEYKPGLASLENCPQFDENESLSRLIKAGIDQNKPLAVTANGKIIGAITYKDLLTTVIEGTETE